jgi:hypothetical protein
MAAVAAVGRKVGAPRMTAAAKANAKAVQQSKQ